MTATDQTGQNAPKANEPAASQDDESTFTTDISETDEEGTTVREAEVRKDDLSEVKKPGSQ